MPGKVARLDLLRRGVYLREGADYVGPFYSRDDAKYFLMLMGVLGVDCAGIEIVELDNDANPGSHDSETNDAMRNWDEFWLTIS